MLLCILKSRGITLLTNGFSSSQVWMWELDHKENWAPKNWCFWMVVLEKTLESPLDCKIKLVSSEYSLEGLVLKLKLQYFWPPDVKTWLIWKCWERLKAGGEGDDSGWDGWMASLTWVWASSRSWWWTGKPGVLQFIGLQRVGQDWATGLNWLTRHQKTIKIKFLPQTSFPKMLNLYKLLK